ncbi:NTP transferase domain-containing protein [bacterium]|nr:NTP transferase domain-containing protein [bacterium]
MRVVAVIQARMSSTRLPGKILEPLGDSTVLGWTVGAARLAKLVDEVTVATSTHLTDDATVGLCNDLHVTCIRGSLEDVLGRYRLAQRSTRADAVVRLTADCPLLDPRLIDQCVAVLRADPSIFMATNALVRSYPRGLDVEVLSKAALEWLDNNSQSSHRSHVTTRLTEEPSGKSIVNLAYGVDNSDLRVTVDTPEDLSLVRSVVNVLGPKARDSDELVALLRQRSDIRALNSQVVQKRWDEE